MSEGERTRLKSSATDAEAGKTPGEEENIDCHCSCSMKDFTLRHEHPIEFVTSQWRSACCGDAVFVSYRVVLALYWLVVLVASWLLGDEYQDKHPERWFIYLTNWGIVLNVSEATFSATATIYYVTSQKKKGRLETATCTPWYLQVLWALQTTSFGASLVISILYWGLTYDASDSNATSFVNYATHLVNSIYVLVNLCIIAIPFHLAHVYLPISFGVIYLAFSAIYQSAGGLNQKDKPYIYSVLDWEKNLEKTMMYGGGALVGMAVCHALLWCLVKVRVFMVRKLRKNQAVKVATSDNHTMATLSGQERA